MMSSSYNLSDSNVEYLIFSRIFTNSTILKFLINTSINKKNSSPFILTNLELRFEPCVFNFIWKCNMQKAQKGRNAIYIFEF
jgi:hypothetical protein